MYWLKIFFLLWMCCIERDAKAADYLPTGVNPNLPVHKHKKIHPELADPVLGDRAAIVEWAWSRKYAEKFGLELQKDGLEDGYLWLLGIKIIRVQSGSRDWQKYQCRIIGLIDNKAPALMPPGDRFVIHPGYHWIGSLPGISTGYGPALTEQRDYQPAQATWHRRPSNKKQEALPENGVGASYIIFHRNYMSSLAYFELDGACAYFGNPANFVNELRFPVNSSKASEVGLVDELVYRPDALRFKIPDDLMFRMYPYIQDAHDWSSCFMRRVGDKSFVISESAKRSNRFGASCEPVLAKARQQQR